MLRMYASDPLFSDWSQLLTDYAMLLNPACWWQGRDVDTRTAEYQADVTMWRERVEELYEELTR